MESSEDKKANFSKVEAAETGGEGGEEAVISVKLAPQDGSVRCENRPQGETNSSFLFIFPTLNYFGETLFARFLLTLKKNKAKRKK